MAEELELFTNPMSRGRIARWMLEEVGVPYRTHMLEYGTTMKAPDYLAVNPMGKVPALRHGDTIVTECAAICTYLADAFPEADLAPPVDERGAYYRWLYFAAGPFEAATVNHSFGFELDAKQQMISGYGRYETVVDVLEQAVTENRFIAGEQFSAADVYIGSHIGWGMQMGSLETRPSFSDYWARISERNACQRATELDNAAMPEKSE